MFKKNKSDFQKFLKQHPFEDLKTIETIDNFFRSKRGYVSKMPIKGSDIIHLVSGGIDSIVSWAILMDKYGLRVHPVCVNTGQKRHIQEIKSIEYFSKIFKKRYPNLYVKPFNLTYPMSAPEISKSLRGNLSKTLDPQVLKNNFDPKTNTITITRKYLFPAFFPYPAALASLFFELQRNLKIRTIFCSILPTDGVYNSSQTLTSIRAASFSLCAFTGDYNWQVISVCFEKELGLFFNKSDLIKWAYKHNLKIENTYSCLKGTKYHCGKCIVCLFRKESFAKARIKDNTEYLDYNKEKKEKRIIALIKILLIPFKKFYKPVLNKIRTMKIARKIFIKDYY